MQEIATIPQDAVSLHGWVPGDLLHPRLVRMNGDPGDVHPAAIEMDEKQRVIGHQPAQRQHLIAQIGQSPRNAVIAPVPVIAGDANNELLHLAREPRSAWAAMGF